MKWSRRSRAFREFARELQARQRNILWEDTFRNNLLVTSFLWKGKPDATPVQRIAMALSGFPFLCLAVLILNLGFFSPTPALFKAVLLLLALPCFAVGLKLLRNAFRR